jgi:hypothetical protein
MRDDSIPTLTRRSPSGPDETTHATPSRLRDLFAMRDGLAFVEVYEIGETSHVIEMLFGEGKSDMAGYTAQLPLAHEPGTFFNYSSGTSQRAQSHRRGPSRLRRRVSRVPRASDSLRAARHDQRRGDLRSRRASSWPRATCTRTHSTSRSSDCCIYVAGSGTAAVDLTRVGRDRAGSSQRGR